MRISKESKKKEKSNQPLPGKLKFSRLKKVLFSLTVTAAVLIITAILLLHKPAGFKPTRLTEEREVSKYLTHVIGRDLYNGAQLAEPFDLVVTEEGINDIVARLKWPKNTGGVRFSVPQVLFEPKKIVLRGMVPIEGVELFVAIECKPFIDAHALLNLPVTKVKLGAINITPIAKVVAERQYRKELARRKADPNDWGTKIAASLIQNRPFEPVLEIENNKVLIEKFSITQKRLVIHFIPVVDELNKQ